MSNKVGFGLIFLLLLLIPISFAKTEYEQAGGEDTLFNLGSGIFNEGFDDDDLDITTLALNDGKLIPLIADLDGDGSNEIIIQDDNLIRIFDDDFNSYQGWNIGSSGDLPSNMIVYDIDGDSTKELIFENDEMLYIFEFNGSALVNQTTFDLFSSDFVRPMHTIQCCGTERCIGYSPKHAYNIGGASQMDIYTFNSNGVLERQVLETSPDAIRGWCPPFVRSITCADYNQDGTDDFIFSAMFMYSGGGDSAKIYYYDTLLNGSMTELDTIWKGSLNPYTTPSNVDCRIGSSYFSAPLVYNFEDEDGSAMETAIAVNIDDDEFKIYLYDVNGDEIDDYPEINEADGIIISNLFWANAWTDIGADFCVMGYEHNDQEIDLLCANRRDAEAITDSREFKYKTKGLYNVTRDAEETWNIITHSAQHSTVTYSFSGETGNPSEIITSYGVFRINWDDIYSIEVPPIYSLDKIWTNPNEDGVLLSIDAKQLNVEGGSEDLIFMTNSNLFYYDDGRTNDEAYISEYTVNPCLDSTWKINTSVGITITVEDPDEDSVSARAVIYYDNENEQDGGWKGNFSSGTTIPFDPDFIANKTIGNAKILLQAYDTENMADIDEIELLFSVGANGVEYGDCTTTTEVEAPTDEIIAPQPAQCNLDSDCNAGYLCINVTCIAPEETTLGQGINEGAELFNIPQSLLWWFIMIGVAIAGIMSAKTFNFPHGALVLGGLVLFIELLLLIVGTKLQVISPVFLIILSTLLVFAVAIWFVKTVFRQQ